MALGEFIAIAAALMAVPHCARHRHHAARPMHQIGCTRSVVEDEKPAPARHQRPMWSVFRCAQLIFGPIADRFRRRGPLLIGLGIYVAPRFSRPLRQASFGCCSHAHPLAGRGGGGDAGSSPSSMVRDRFGDARWRRVYVARHDGVQMIVPVIARGGGRCSCSSPTWADLIIPSYGLRRGRLCPLVLSCACPEGLAEKNAGASTAHDLDGFRIVLGNRLASFCYAARHGADLRRPVRLHQFRAAIFIDVYALGAWFPVLFPVLAA